MLDNLDGASRGKDVDEKEVRALRSGLLKLFRIWDKALLEGHDDPRSEEMVRRIEKQASQGQERRGLVSVRRVRCEQDTGR
jgi:hypothetical protein